MAESQQHKEKIKEKTRRRGCLGKIFITFVIVLLLLVVLVFLVNRPAVQKWGIDKISARMSARTGSTVKLDAFQLHIFKDLRLKGVFISDTKGDSMVVVDDLDVDFKRGLFSLFFKELDLKNIYLKNGLINLYSDEGYNNLGDFIDKLSSSDKKKNRSTLNKLALNALRFDNIQLKRKDIVSGMEMDIYIPQGDMEFQPFHSSDNKLEADRISLINPRVFIHLLERDEERFAAIPTDTFSSPFSFFADEVLVEEAEVRFINDRGEKKFNVYDGIDYTNMHFKDVNINAQNVRGSVDSVVAEISHLALQDNRDRMRIRESYATKVSVTNKNVSIEDLLIETDKSILRDYIGFRFNGGNSWRDFVNRVFLDVNFDESKVNFRDLLYFAPGLYEVDFFRVNRNETVRAEGKVKGKVNRLKGEDLFLVFDNGTRLKGDLSSRNLAIKGEEMLNLKLTEFISTTDFVQGFIPNVALPQNVSRMGNLNFKGRFDGYFQNFVAYGELISDLGFAEMDMSLNLYPGREKAEYSGNLALTGFDLAKWLDDEAFGTTSLNVKLSDGVGLNMESAEAIFDGLIEGLTFKGYTYENIDINGRLQRNKFSGDLDIHDDNIDFSFAGEVDFTGDQPLFDFTSDVQEIDLFALNLAKKPVNISGKFDLNMKGSSLDGLSGSGKTEDLVILMEDTATIEVKDLIADISFDQDSVRKISLSSNLLDAEMEGKYSFSDVHERVLGLLAKDNAELARKFNLPTKYGSDLAFFELTASVKDLEGLGNLFVPGLGDLEGSDLVVSFDGNSEQLNLALDAPEFIYNKIATDSLSIRVDNSIGNTDISITTDSIFTGGNLVIAPSGMVFRLADNRLRYNLMTPGVGNHLTDISLDGNAWLQDNHFAFSLPGTQLNFVGEAWNVMNDNPIILDKGYIVAENFSMGTVGRYLTFNAEESGAAYLEAYGLDMSILDVFWDYDKLDFAGPLDLIVETEDLFHLSKLKIDGTVDSLFINDDHFGLMKLAARSGEGDSPIITTIDITNDTASLKANGEFTNFKSKDKRGFNFDIEIKDYPLAIADYWIGHSVSGTQGTLDANLVLYRRDGKANMEGTGLAKNGQVTVDYIGTTYNMDNGIILVKPDIFDFSRIKIFDEWGNRARLSGGIRHYNLKDLYLDVNLFTNRFAGLNTTELQNPDYYGRAFAGGDIYFSGPFDKPNIEVNAIALEGSELNLPVDYAYTPGESSFVRFEDEVKIEIDESEKKSELNVDMNFTIHPEAVVRILFDEKAGDIMEGQGTGNIEFSVNRAGEISMKGKYNIESGSYTYTINDFLFNKPFRVKPGGSIIWDGDPFLALIDVTAVYEGKKRIKPYSLIEEYLSDDASPITAEAKSLTAFELTLLLTGNLLEPNIDFFMDFPDLTGELKSLTDNKIRAMQLDKNELYRQAGFVILFGTFASTANQSASLGSAALSLGVNTLSEFLSNQLSLLLEDYFSEIIDEVGFISGLDFDVYWDPANDEGDVDTGPTIRTGGEAGINLTPRFFDDRLELDIEGGYYTQSSGSETNPLYGNFIITYKLSPEGNLKVKLYSKSQQVTTGRHNKFGGGISFQREFDTLRELFGIAVKDVVDREG